LNPVYMHPMHAYCRYTTARYIYPVGSKAFFGGITLAMYTIMDIFSTLFFL